MSVSINQGNAICSFSRDNFNDNPKYYDIYPGDYPYLLIAYGTGSINYHNQNRFVTQYGINLVNESSKLTFCINIYLMLLILISILNQ